MMSRFGGIQCGLLCLAVLGMAACGGGGAGGSGAPPSDGGPPGEPVFSSDIRLNTDPAGEELSLVPDLCCDGDTIYVVWYDRRDGNLDIYFNRSRDGGRTWLASDRRLDSDRPGAAGSLIPRICCSGEAVYVVWYDERNGEADIYFNRSLDGGDHWLAADRRLDTDAAGTAASREPRLCCDGANVYVTWYDRRSGDYDIRFNRSIDGGSNWLASDLRVDRGAPQTRAELPCIGCSGSQVHIAWRDERAGGADVYASRSQDGGLSWPAGDQRLNTDGPGSGSANAPRLVCAGSRVYVVWSDRRDGAADIRFNRSVDAGGTWLQDDVRLDGGQAGAADSVTPELCASGDAVSVVWGDGRNGDDDIYFRGSKDAGLTWPVAAARLEDDLPGRAVSFDPHICCDGPSVSVVWRDDRDGRFDVRLTYSPDQGSQWLTSALRLDSDAAGAGHSVAPRACCDGQRVHVAWYDQRSGPGDIYFNRADFELP